jgi:hypothetical protein
MKLASICRTKEIRGHEFPGIIHNGSFFLTDLQVFADGLINCWEMVDLPMFKSKLRNGWVVTSIPNHAPLNIHGIGSILVTEPSWTHTPTSIVTFIQDIVKTLNPRLENLHDCHGRDTEVINGVRYAAVSMDNPRPWKAEQPITPLTDGIFGSSLRHFENRGGVFHLVTIQLFKDDSAVIFGAGEPRTLAFDALMKQLEAQERFLLPEPGATVVIDGLVKFTAGSWEYRVDQTSLKAEFLDLHNRVQGRPGVIRACLLAYQEYLAQPTAQTKQALREKYEEVPKHLQRYCGDMDCKDIPIRMILFGESEIENWSHYQVAKELGHPLPSINLPVPPA